VRITALPTKLGLGLLELAQDRGRTAKADGKIHTIRAR
jgi:hypothetical protein